MLPAIGLTHYLILGAVLFVFGFICVMSRKNAIGLLMGVELILNAANVNFVAFGRYVEGLSAGVTGQILALFVIVLAAAEAAVALAIVLALYQNAHTIDVDTLEAQRGPTLESLATDRIW
ncbi:MAG: NADH-quinone oxidoreductase subunit NuoK [Deltaproteobacteria bacterium]|nr:NADH-quinone oxidoreductase subunit NuoK [Deltaproteobacteria bacterium]